MTTSRLATLLLLSTALALPTQALAQQAPADPPPAEPAVETPAEPEAPVEEQVDVSLPGEIVVTGRQDRNVAKSSDQVVSVLSSAEIARTGEGNIAGALGRVTGLSIVGSGFVYVRGLGDRYSLALLNGSPLPSPEPLRRVVPLDIFPTNVVASSLVQKSYSVNFPGEFGGGVVNLTTTAVPKEGFLTISAGMSGDTETTGQFGYSYFGSRTDWTGFDNGSRDVPPALAAFFASGNKISDLAVDDQAVAGELVRFSRATLQRIPNLPVNFSGSISGGTAWDVGDDARLGLIATVGFSNRWTNRDARQQTPAAADLSELFSDTQRVTTDNRIIANGLLGLGLELGRHKFRFTNLFIRDTIKQGRLAQTDDFNSGFTRQNQDTAWFERQLFETQLVTELKFGDVSLDLRGTYANSQREAPYELSFGYARTNRATDPTGQYFVNRLNNGQVGSASVAFSDLNEDLWAASADLSWLVTPRLTVSTGYAFSDTKRQSSRREFQFIAPSDFPVGVAMLRPDLLLSPGIIDYFNIGLVETTESDPAFAAALRVHGGYGKVNWEPIDGLSLDLGVRYETALQTVNPIEVFKVPSNSLAGTRLDKGYWLPAGTITWEIAPQMQLRANASQTIARPQFRELIFQLYYDPESDRLFRGNPLLTDSKLFNAEARWEWYFAREQRLSLAGFFKKIDRPIEAFTGFSDNQPQTSFANAPRARLYGAELEVQKYFDLESLGGFFALRRLVTIANYTYTKSEIQVRPGDTVAIFGTSVQPASNVFVDGVPLTGQSNHLANLQLGFEHPDRLSQQTLMLTYASKRVTSRGPVGQPDIVENPGLRLDLVLREGVKLLGREVDLKFEARNLTGRKREEFQSNGTNRVEINTYDVGRSFSISASVKF
ncbi:TonB-dependent receptor [Novosphingobium sp.]|uniref:TonB-dependent receptor domain-containing protein n=1 Tax=Novosphingobium sp. TaxID=1874826 RepID=UPI0022CD1D2C|nr:TonB-dependent receptor [Novosphingobium sp.]MCZ8019981.1 TonB-dependent receptor [Novosphingobium sp.]MCZ8035626.1 TonB-dependent receptor [Novosphingobium sp.]MCZ8053024.1 TonB-dependent receptor [Novosphingobium sp.]MCZ8061021.1 TonB-dependent receptor [Novosphingobium sp.]MCZ8230750.1 TonB-dependent receptor [Novosphingobium sp.]